MGGFAGGFGTQGLGGTKAQAVQDDEEERGVELGGHGDAKAQLCDSQVGRSIAPQPSRRNFHIKNRSGTSHNNDSAKIWYARLRRSSGLALRLAVRNTLFYHQTQRSITILQELSHSSVPALPVTK
jgi:hypothetical protein